MSVFLRWNDALATHFFKPEVAGQSVWLYVSEELIVNIGDSLGLGGVTDFVTAAKDGPPWPTPSGLCQIALKTCEGWRDRNLEYPPYLAYLALFVLAAGLEGDFAAHAYYPRLRTLLGEPPTTGEIPSFHRMYELWDDLERWSVRDRKGELGIVQARIAGGMFHIGLPLGQSVLADQDRRALPLIFARAEFDPSATPPDAEVLRALRSHGGDLLRPRTVKLLEGSGDRELLEALVDLVAEELSEWNGEAPAENGRGGRSGGDRQVLAGLRLCMRLDRTAGRAQTSIRCTLNRREFPEGGLVLSLGADTYASCDEEVPGWSTPLAETGLDEPLDAARFDWPHGLSASEARLGWRFRLPPRSLRVLVSGLSIGLHGLVEAHQLPHNQPFYLLFRQDEWSHIEQWARESCEGFEIIGIRDGLPSGWQLGSASRVTANDAAVARRYPVLARSERISLRLTGGIRSAPGNSFFAFAPPRIVADGGTDAAVRCDGRALSVSADGVSYQLPESLTLETRILIEAVQGSEVLKRQSLYLTGEFAWNRSEALETYGQWGEQQSASGDSAGRIVGAMLLDEVEQTQFKRPVLLAPGLAPHIDRRIFFIGRVPGEIVTWPIESLPSTWDPVWAVPMVRRGVAIYCGGGIDESAPLAAESLHRDQVEQWKDLLWHRRKRITPPSQRRLATLWRLYLESARDA